MSYSQSIHDSASGPAYFFVYLEMEIKMIKLFSYNHKHYYKSRKKIEIEENLGH